jgi:antitoxin (DNA-binding transcriptional repressor) of toxin-antitoxin stability system
MPKATPSMNASRLRANIYRILDRVLETGIPVEIERRGRLLRIVPEKKPAKLELLPKRPEAVRGAPGDLVHVDWSKNWRPGRM